MIENFDIQDIPGSDAPWLIFGGPYSNLPATRALRAKADALGIPAARCICTGDTVAYCASPAQTVAELRDWGCWVVAGNCERQIAQGALDCGCGFEAGSSCDLLSVGWFRHASAAIEGEAANWMAALPDALRFDHAGNRCIALHGGVTDISAFLWPTTEAEVFSREIAQLGANCAVDVVLAGHSGVPFERDLGQQRWINAGVIGMPPHDGHPDTRYAILHDGRASIHRLSYDWRTARIQMERAGLIHGYHAALQTGFWPSEDILPPSLRRGAGAAAP